MISNEQRAHEFALKYAELKFEQLNKLSEVSHSIDSLSFSDLYIEAYNVMVEKLNV